MPQTKEHNQVVREEFTRQATAYAANPVIADPERVARLVQAVRPTSQDRVLEGLPARRRPTRRIR